MSVEAGVENAVRTTDAGPLARSLAEVAELRALAARDAHEVAQLREDLRQALARVEREARTEAGRFDPPDLGPELRHRLSRPFRGAPPRRPPQAPPPTLAAAEQEWRRLGEIHWKVDELATARVNWNHAMLRRRRTMPSVPPEVWAALDRLTEVRAALPALREAFVAERLRAHAHLRDELAAEAERRAAELGRRAQLARERIERLATAARLPGAAWDDPRWAGAAPPGAPEPAALRAGELETGLPASLELATIPALIDFPFRAGLVVSAGVEQRQAAVDLVRSLVVRLLASVPAGDVRFVFLDPVSLGRSVAELRHLAEFEPQLVDVKTWTSERDIEARLDELADHLEVVISNYLRGQFASIDEYNREAGEVAEPYRVLVVLDYPEGFSTRSARQLLSLVENGPRCGVHTLLLHDPGRGSPEDVPLERLTHSMQRIELRGDAGARLALAEPVGAVELPFVPDAGPAIAFAPDGEPRTPAAELLLNVGTAARTTQAGPVTLARLMPVANRLIGSRRSRRVAELRDGAPVLDPADPGTWWNGTTARGAYAPIGRAGAQDVAALWFSSTEIAGGAIVVGVPRSGKSTALHAAILTLSLLYAPDELELYLVDSKHGVELKVYDRLPHARLVSVNSERELAVSVLRSLDAEIARRAELMKRRTAGKANVTEYRAATGETLPRVVLLMDEFHEVFEEDDALGQAAFQAFSNIVRQGPFAGVHVVVASQTLSSMPAMDRSTLALLPMRVAFMCNEADADLVMGDANREVRALSQQGEGIFNPARGDPSHNKPFRGLYVAPDERAGLLREIEAKAAAHGLARRPRVFDGDTPAERPAEGPGGAPARPLIALGEPFTLEPSAGVALRRRRAANLLLLGAEDDDERADTRDASLAGAVASCLADAAAHGLTATLVDFAGDGGGDDESLSARELCAALMLDYRRGSALAEVVAEHAACVRERQRAGAYDEPGRLLVLDGLQRALDLVPEDPYADDEGGAAQETAAQLAQLLRDGPEVGCHVAVVVDGLAQLDSRLGRDLLKEFEWRVATSGLGVADVLAVAESYAEGEIRRNQLLIVDYDRRRTRRVRAYPPHTRVSLGRIAAGREP